MSRRPLALATVTLALLALARPARAQQEFQGAITMQMTGEDGASHDATFLVKGNRLRMEMAAPSGEGTFAMITDQEAKKSWMLMPGRQMYMERDLDAAPPARMGNQPERPKPTIAWSGKKETIAGMECEDATSTEADGTVYDLCIARGIPFFMGGGPGRGMGRGAGGGMGRGAAGGGAEWARAAEGGFPLRAQKRGTAAPQMIATKVERKALADDQFAPPAGWQKMSLPMGGMGGGRP